METLKIIAIISLVINVILGIMLLGQSIRLRKVKSAEPKVKVRISRSTMKEIVDECLPKNTPSMSELEEA